MIIYYSNFTNFGYITIYFHLGDDDNSVRNYWVVAGVGAGVGIIIITLVLIVVITRWRNNHRTR